MPTRPADWGLQLHEHGITQESTLDLDFDHFSSNVGGWEVPVDLKALPPPLPDLKALEQKRKREGAPARPGAVRLQEVLRVCQGLEAEADRSQQHAELAARVAGYLGEMRQQACVPGLAHRTGGVHGLRAGAMHLKYLATAH
jgi:hypothetical protein